MSETLGLVLKNDSGELVRLTAALDSFSDRAGLPDEARFNLQLCVEELVLNVVNHGFDGAAGEHDILVDLQFQEDSRTLTVQITDDGRAFDPVSDAPVPKLDASLEDRPLGGLGLHLVRTLMDDISYRREEGRNHLALTMHVEA